MFNVENETIELELIIRQQADQLQEQNELIRYLQQRVQQLEIDLGDAELEMYELRQLPLVF